MSAAPQLAAVGGSAPSRCRTPPGRRCASASRRGDGSGREVYTVALVGPDPPRAGQAALRRRGRGRAPRRPLRRARALAGHDPPLPLEPRRRARAELLRRHRVRPARAVHLRPRGRAGPSTSPRSTDGDVPLTFHFSGNVLYRGEGGRLQIVQVPWESSAAFALPVTTWRGMIESLLPGQRLDPAARGHPRRPAPRRPPSAGCRRWTRACSTCWPSGRGAVSRARDDACVEELLDSLLFEGYALYPYTAGATKNATPTPFGIVYPPAYAAGADGPLDHLQAAVPGAVGAGAAVVAPRSGSCRRRGSATGRRAARRGSTAPGSAAADRLPAPARRWRGCRSTRRARASPA